MPTVPGAVGAFRRRALLQVGGLSDDTWLRTPTSPSPSGGPAGTSSTSRRPRGWTEAPRRLGQLWLQRYRWCYGTMQSMWKHRRALVDRGASGRMGRLGLLNLVLIESVLTAVAGYAPALAQAAPHRRPACRAGRRHGDPLGMSAGAEDGVSRP